MIKTQERIEALLEQLNALQKEKLLEFIEAMLGKMASPNPQRMQLLLGAISPSDLSQMQQAIEEDCNRVDENEW